MIKRSPGIANIKASYRFPEIAKERREFAESHLGAKIISPGAGNAIKPMLSRINPGLGTAEGGLAILSV